MASGLGTLVIGLAELRRNGRATRCRITVEGPLPGLRSRRQPRRRRCRRRPLAHPRDPRRRAAHRHRPGDSAVERRPAGAACRTSTGVVDVEVSEVFEAEPADDAETYPLGGDRVDLEPMVRDAVLLALPLAPLCRDDCAGPDPDDHPVGTGEARARRPTPGGPRWVS